MLSSETQSPLTLVPYGQLVSRDWLVSQGVGTHTIDNWLKSRQLQAAAHAVYQRPEAKLAWQSVVCSLQRMGNDLRPGGVTAMMLHGLGHYAELGQKKTAHLYGRDALPAWANRLLPDVTFVRHGTARLFEDTFKPFTTNFTWGTDEWPYRVSSPEQAWFELLAGVPQDVSFDYADQVMQGLVNLSPQRLNTLLECCVNVKVRRLFFWFAERHDHAWLRKVERDRYTMESGLLGSGKRALAKGGVLDPKYLITVPEHMHGLE